MNLASDFNLGNSDILLSSAEVENIYHASYTDPEWSTSFQSFPSYNSVHHQQLSDIKALQILLQYWTQSSHQQLGERDSD